MDHITDYLFILGFSQEFSTSKCSIPPHLYTSSLYTLIVCFPTQTLARYCYLATAHHEMIRTGLKVSYEACSC